MKIKAQVSMVMNLTNVSDAIHAALHKNTWTNRPGAEYMYFNNVETKPGVGYPKQWEDQERYRGGWEMKMASWS